MNRGTYAAIDEALEILKDTGPEFGLSELSNHGPMAAEAMCAMGRAEAVVSWVERYRRRLHEHPHRRAAIDRDSWRAALGDFSRAGDWAVFFESELARAPWPEVLDRWANALAPGAIAAAFHGLIRTGHAVRSLSIEENPGRLRELAEGLAYWAARYRQLPAGRGRAAAMSPSGAIGEVALLPPESRDQSSKNIDQRLEGLSGFAPFHRAINLVAADAQGFLSDLTETFARVYLANCADLRTVIPLIHAVTGPAAIRLMVPHLSRATTDKMMRYCWQGAAALYAGFALRAQPGEVRAPEQSGEELVERAIRSGDEHAIKFTEACLREHALNPSPVYLAAARHVSSVLGGG